MKNSIIFFIELASRFFTIYLHKEIVCSAILTAKRCGVLNTTYKDLLISVRYLPSTDSFRLTISNSDTVVSLYTKDNTLEIIYTPQKNQFAEGIFNWEEFEKEIKE